MIARVKLDEHRERWPLPRKKGKNLFPVYFDGIVIGHGKHMKVQILLPNGSIVRPAQDVIFSREILPRDAEAQADRRELDFSTPMQWPS